MTSQRWRRIRANKRVNASARRVGRSTALLHSIAICGCADQQENDRESVRRPQPQATRRSLLVQEYQASRLLVSERAVRAAKKTTGQTGPNAKI